jgi:hypothetical protein
MSYKFQFRKEDLKKVEQDYSQVKLEPSQRIMIESISKLYENILGLSALPARGFMAFVIRDFQLEYKIDMKTFHNLPLNERTSHAKTMGNMMYKRLERILIDPTKKEALKGVIEKGIKIAMKQ